MQLQRHTKCGVIHSSEAAPSAGSLEEHHAVANSFSLLQANKEVTLALQPATTGPLTQKNYILLFFYHSM